MDRRKFLSMLAVGAPAAVIAPKLGLIEKARKYFFAPDVGWTISGSLYVRYPNAEQIAMQLEDYMRVITRQMQRDSRLFDQIQLTDKMYTVSMRPRLSFPLAPPNRQARIVAFS
jgi:hypothetical protein